MPPAEKRTNSGRTPSSRGAGPGARSGADSTAIRSPSKTTSRPAISHGRMFIPGEPMKCPTKVCLGFSNSSTGVPTCTTAPSYITTTVSANVSASVWSWVT